MRRWLLAAALLFSACAWVSAEEKSASAPDGAKQRVAEDDALAVFQSAPGAIRLPFPKGWYVLDGKLPQGYRVRATPKQPDPTRPFEPFLVDLSKFAQAPTRLKLGQGTPQQLTDRYAQHLLTRMRGRVLKQEWITIQGLRGRLVEASATDDHDVRHRVMIVVVVYGDVLASLLCEAPPEEFDTYRKTFRRIAETMEPFAAIE